ncbi:hypothetical protein [Streptomyces sp. NPDC050535]|uniref:hypothetical protein n=1 Tax=Streptomyces sp. NPDC050535 TaxID=3365626 RepID=UPI003788823B
MKHIRALAGIGLGASAALFIAAPQAQAASYNGCIYPRVCFYQTLADWNAAAPNAAYQDVTTAYQNLGSSSRGADHVWNTRNDDRAMIRYLYQGGTYYTCLAPNSGRTFPSSMTVTGIRIDTASTC